MWKMFYFRESKLCYLIYKRSISATATWVPQQPRVEHGPHRDAQPPGHSDLGESKASRRSYPAGAAPDSETRSQQGPKRRKSAQGPTATGADPISDESDSR